MAASVNIFTATFVPARYHGPDKRAPSHPEKLLDFVFAYFEGRIHSERVRRVLATRAAILHYFSEEIP
jgi:hypothetical protein